MRFPTVLTWFVSRLTRTHYACTTDSFELILRRFTYLLPLPTRLTCLQTFVAVLFWGRFSCRTTQRYLAFFVVCFCACCYKNLLPAPFYHLPFLPAATFTLLHRACCCWTIPACCQRFMTVLLLLFALPCSYVFCLFYFCRRSDLPCSVPAIPRNCIRFSHLLPSTLRSARAFVPPFRVSNHYVSTTFICFHPIPSGFKFN